MTVNPILYHVGLFCIGWTISDILIMIKKGF